MSLVGCSTLCLLPSPLEEALEALAAEGFASVDLVAVPTAFTQIEIVDPPPNQAGTVVRHLRRLNLDVDAVVSYPRYPDAADDPDELERRCRIAADLARAVGARVWVLDAGTPARPNNPSRSPLERLRATLTRAAELATERDLRLAVECPHAGSLAETVIDAVRLLDNLGVAELGLALDTYHVARGGETVPDAIAAVAPRLAHVALGDHKEGRLCPPGDGDVDFEAALGALADHGWKAPVTIEFLPQRGRLEDRVAAVRRARAHLLAMAVS